MGMLAPNQYAVKVDESKKQMEDAAEIIRAASEQMVAASSAKDQFIPGTTKTAESLRVENVGKMEAELKAQNAAKAADWENLSIILGQDLAQMAHERRGIAQKIVQDSSVSLWDDPALALANAFTLPWDEQRLDALDTEVEKTKATMAAINTTVQQAAVTANAIKTSVTQETLASEAAAVANLFAQKAAIAKIEGAKNNSEMISKVLSMDAHAMDAYMKQQQLADQAEAREMRQKQFERQMKLFDMQIAKEERTEQADETRLKLINAALLREGKDPWDKGRYDVLKGTSGQLVDQLMHKGLEIAIKGANNVSDGATIEERFKWWSVSGFKPKNPQQERIVLMQQKALNAAAEATKNKSLVPVNAEQTFNTAFKQEQDNIMEGSPLRLPSAVIYAQHSSLMKEPIWQKYIAPTLNEGNAQSPLSEEVVIGAAVQAMLKGEVKSTEAADFVTAVINQGMAVNNLVLDLEKIAGRKQTKYGYRLGTGLMPGKTTYNLADRVEVQAALQGKVMREFGLAGRNLLSGSK